MVGGGHDDGGLLRKKGLGVDSLGVDSLGVDS